MTDFTEKIKQEGIKYEEYLKTWGAARKETVPSDQNLAEVASKN